MNRGTPYRDHIQVGKTELARSCPSNVELFQNQPEAQRAGVMSVTLSAHRRSALARLSRTRTRYGSDSDSVPLEYPGRSLVRSLRVLCPSDIRGSMRSSQSPTWDHATSFFLVRSARIGVRGSKFEVRSSTWGIVGFQVELGKWGRSVL